MTEINLVSCSGGKDSTAMLLLAIERETPNLQVVFCDTGNEHKLTYEYIDYLQDKLGMKFLLAKADYSEKINKKRIKLIAENAPQRRIDALVPTGIPFLDCALYHGRFPSTQSRFCTTELKRDAVKEQIYDPILKQGTDIISWQGIRWDESKARSCAKEKDFAYSNEETGAEVWNYRPILSWTAEDTFAMMKKHGIDPNPLYKLGMNRVGCMPCVCCRKSELAAIASRFPDVIDRIEKWEERVSSSSSRNGSSFFPWNEAMGTHTIRDVVAWAKTDRGGRQFGLFDDWEHLPACSSNYGLCELE